MEQCKTLLFVVEFGRHWMGGVYYVRNLLTTILMNEQIAKSRVIILCPTEHWPVFADLSKYKNIVIIDRKSPFQKINAAIRKFLAPFHRDFPLDVVWYANRLNAHSIFPVTGFPWIGGSKRCIFWIPDFQHFMLPQIFKKQELSYRTNLYSAISSSGCRLLLSSQDASSHYHGIFPKAKTASICIPFVSDIENEVEKLTPELEVALLKSFGLMETGQISQYIYISNQFWSHKNHLTALKGFAIYCRRNPDSKLRVVCTGSTQDYRAKDYFPRVRDLIDSLGIIDRVVILEFIDRLAQIAILKNCTVLVQPSLFEGWGTGVQEAKRFAKKILLSDIPIHIEQGDERSMRFAPNSPDDFAGKLEVILNASFPEMSDSENKFRYFAFAKKYSIPASDLFLKNTRSLEAN